MSGLVVTARDDGTVRFSVRVQPRASRASVHGVHGDALRVRVHAPPVEGAANAAVVAVIAEALGVARRDVRIVSGESARSKLLEVRGVSVEAVRALA